MNVVSSHLTHDALELGNSFKRSELELEKKKQRLELEILDVKSQRDAARVAFERGLKFTPTINGEPQCPRCWVSQGLATHLHAVPSETADDIFRCGSCQYEAVIPGG